MGWELQVRVIFQIGLKYQYNYLMAYDVQNKNLAIFICNLLIIRGISNAKSSQTIFMVKKNEH